MKKMALSAMVIAGMTITPWAHATGDPGTDQMYQRLSPQQKQVAHDVEQNLLQRGDTSKGFVGVPPNYVYNPDLGSLHDYCTDAPDASGPADFRGPCAIHDMCYEQPGDHKAQCDNELQNNMGANCDAAIPVGTQANAQCKQTVAVYYAAVTAGGDDN